MRSARSREALTGEQPGAEPPRRRHWWRWFLGGAGAVAGFRITGPGGYGFFGSLASDYALLLILRSRQG
jgi:hypothetical protein